MGSSSLILIQNLENDDTFDDFIDSTKGKCNLMIHVPVDVSMFGRPRLPLPRNTTLILFTHT